MRISLVIASCVVTIAVSLVVISVLILVSFLRVIRACTFITRVEEKSEAKDPEKE